MRELGEVAVEFWRAEPLDLVQLLLPRATVCRRVARADVSAGLALAAEATLRDGARVAVVTWGAVRASCAGCCYASV